MFTLVGFLAVFFQVDGDGDEPEVGEEGPVEPVVAGGGPAAALHAVEDAFGHVPPPPARLAATYEKISPYKNGDGLELD